jgi:hypothetical protein
VMRAAGDSREGVRLRAVIVVLWRAGLRISEALALRESDLDRQRGAVLVRVGKGGRRREVGMDRWGCERLEPWLELRRRCRSVRCSACCADRRVVGRAHRPGSAASCVTRPNQPAFVVGSHPTSCGMRTRSRCLVKGFHYWSSSANTPISGSRRLTCAGSITPRPSTPSTNVPHP